MGHSQMAQVSGLEAELEGLAAVEVEVEFSLGINCNDDGGRINDEKFGRHALV